MDPGKVEAGGRGAEADPLWAEVVDRVICDGRPGFLTDAADRYEHLLRRMHEEATTIEDELARLAQSWDGAAFAAYHAAVETIVDDLRRAAGVARGVADALRLAAGLLRGHQERIPVPERLVGEIIRAHHQRHESGGGVAPSNADFERAIHDDILARAPWLAGPQAVEQAHALFRDQQDVARRIYRRLSAAYGEVEALLPAPAAAPATHGSHKQVAPRHKGTTEKSEVDLTLGGEADGTEAGVVDLPVLGVLGEDDDDRIRSAGNLSGSSPGSGPGGGPAAGGGSTDTGAAFGTPVSVMSTPGINTGMSMGAGTHLSTPIGPGHGGVIGVIGDGDTHSTWLTDDDDPFHQDGHSSGAVLT